MRKPTCVISIFSPNKTVFGFKYRTLGSLDNKRDNEKDQKAAQDGKSEEERPQVLRPRGRKLALALNVVVEGAVRGVLVGRSLWTWWA